MMSAHSPANSFFEISGFYQESSSEAPPAKTSAPPTPKAKASKVSAAASTSKQSASSEKSALVGSLLRTALISELEAQTSCSLHWRNSATPAGRSWSVLATVKVEPVSEPTTSALGHGSSGATLHRLPTPMASDGMKDGKGGGAGSTYPFRKILATPRASDASHGPEIAKAHADKSTGVSLVTMLEMGRRQMLPTPVKPNGGRSLSVEAIETGKRANGAKAQVDTPNMLKHAFTMLGTPTANAAPRGSVLRRMKGEMHSAQDDFDRTPTISEAIHFHEKGLPTPTKRDKRMDRWSPAYDKRKSPTMDAVLDGAMTGKAPGKWDYARQIAAMLSDAGLTGPSMTLPITYNWMMGYPPGWLGRALRSAVHAGLLQQASSLKRSGTR